MLKFYKQHFQKKKDLYIKVNLESDFNENSTEKSYYTRLFYNLLKLDFK